MLLPPLRALLGTTPIDVIDALVIALAATTPTLVRELLKPPIQVQQDNARDDVLAALRAQLRARASG